MDDRPRLLLIDDGEAYADTIAKHMPDVVLLDVGAAEQPRAPDGPTALKYLEQNARRVDLVLLDMRFDVRISYPPLLDLSCHGVVVTQHPSGFGLQLTLTDAARSTLRLSAGPRPREV